MPTYTINGDHNPAAGVDNLEASWVNFAVLTAGTVVINVANTVGADDVVAYLYRRLPDGTVVLLDSADATVGVANETFVVDLQAGDYFIIFSPFDFGDGTVPNPNPGPDVDTGVNPELGDPDAAGGSWVVEIIDNVEAVPGGTSLVSVSDGFDVAYGGASVNEDAANTTVVAETLAFDVGGDNLTVLSVRNAVGGTATVDVNGNVVFDYAANFNGVASFVYDLTDGNGIVTGVWTIAVNAVNDEPAGTNGSDTIPEDTSYIFNSGDFGFSDPDGHAFGGIRIAAAPTNGVLQFDTDAGAGATWVNLTYPAIISVADLDDVDGGRLRFLPDPNEFGTPYATFQFQVIDNGDNATFDSAGGLAGDDSIDSTPNTYTMNVTALDDDAYLAVDDGAPGAPYHTLVEDVPQTFNITGFLGNDINPDPDGFVVSSISNLFQDLDGPGGAPAVLVGTIAYNTVTGDYTITPNANFNTGTGVGNFTAYFDYVVSTDDATFDTGRVFVNVTPVNDAPVGTDNSFTIAEDTVDTLTAADFGFSDPVEGHAFAGIIVTSLPTNGTLFVNGVPATAGQYVTAAQIAANQLTFSPDLNENNDTLPDANYATFTFQVRDAGDDTVAGNGDDAIDASPNTITYSVTPVNDAPVGNPDVYNSTEDTVLVVNAVNGVLANDNDGDPEPSAGADQALRVTGIVQPIVGGTISMNPDGSFTYTPTPNYSGVVNFSYTVADDGPDGIAGNGDDASTSGVSVTINVGNTADNPVAGDDGPYNVTEDVPFQANGFGPNPGGIPFRINANGFFLESDLLANDTDPDGPPLDITGVGAAVNGTVQLYTSPAGVQYVVFTPNANYSGPASFDYAVTDPQGNTDIGRVSLIVREVADGPPVAGDDVIAATEDVVRTYTAAELLGNDTDPDNAGSGAGTDQLTIRAIQNLVGVRLSDGLDGIQGTLDDGNIVTDAYGNILSFELVTTSDVNGAPASFDYVVDDSAARDDVIGDTDGPPGALLNPPFSPGTQGPGVIRDEGPDGSGVDQAGAPDTRTGTDIGTVTLNLTYVNDAPIAFDDVTLAINEDSVAGRTFNQAFLLGNDVDPDNAGTLANPANAGLTVVSVGGLTPGSGASAAVNGGTLTANLDGTFTFVPSANFNGNATFSYVIQDTAGVQDTGLVTVPVNAINDAPVANPDGVLPVGLLELPNFGAPAVQNNANLPLAPGNPLVVEDGSSTFTWAQLLANDNDGDPTGSAADSQALRITGGASTFGTVTVDTVNQTVTFTPTPGFVGAATFTYTLADDGNDSIVGNGDDLTATGTVNVNVVDTVIGSAGNDTINPDQGVTQQSINAFGGAGNDTLNGTNNIDQLFGEANNDTLNGLGGDDYLYGGSGNDGLNGGDGNDSLYTNGGGTDNAQGGNGNDGIFAGNDLDSTDTNDGGAGSDTLAIQGGGYAGGYLFGATNMLSIETLVVASGQVAGLWPNPVGPGPFDYNLVTQDANVAAGAILTVIANGLGNGIPGLGAAEDLLFDGSDEKDGSFRIYAGQGDDTFIGGEQNDGFFFETGAWQNGGDSFVDGRNGTDSIAFRGNYSGGNAINLGSNVIRTEVVALLSESEGAFGGLVGFTGTFDYTLTTGDAQTAAGATLTVSGLGLQSNETLVFNGNAELNGNLTILGGAANDTISGGRQTTPLIGGGGTDLIYGGLGGDTMNGGVANDTFLVNRSYDGNNVYAYRAAAESAATSTSLAGIDRIAGFDWTLDDIDINAGGPAVNGLVNGIAGVNVTDVNVLANGNLSLDYGLGAAGNAAAFNSALATQLNAILNPNEAAVLRVTTGDLAGSEVFVQDSNGNGSYDAGDLVIIFDNLVSQLPPSTDFII